MLPNGCVPSHALASVNLQSVSPADRRLGVFISSLAAVVLRLAFRGLAYIGFGATSVLFLMTIRPVTTEWLATRFFRTYRYQKIAFTQFRQRVSLRTRRQLTIKCCCNATMARGGLT